MAKKIIEEAAVLPDYLKLSDDELMKMSNREFADAMVDRARQWVREVSDPGKFEIRKLTPEERREACRHWAERHAWMEWWFGVPVPAKQLLLLPNEDFGIKVLLSQQIIDEVKHQRVLSRRAAALGGSSRIEHYVPEKEVTENAPEKMTDNEDPVEIAAALQCTGEVVLNDNTDFSHSVLDRLLDEDTKKVITEELAPDEIRHIGVGVKLLTKYAGTPEIRRRLLKIQNRKLHSTYQRYLADYRGLGAERIAPEPILGDEST